MGKRRRKRDESASALGTLLIIALTIPIAEGLFASDLIIMRYVKALGVAILILVMLALIVVLLRRQKRQGDAKFDFDEEQPNTRRDHAFEHEVAHLIRLTTNKRTEVVGGPGDGGVDIKVFDGEKLVGIVQCKHAANTHKALPPIYIRDLKSTMHYHHVNVAYLVTNARFSDQSRVLAKQLGIRLIDGAQLAEMRRRVASVPQGKP